MPASLSQTDSLVLIDGLAFAAEAAASPRRPLFGLSREALIEAMAALGEKPYRGRQLADALYRSG